MGLIQAYMIVYASLLQNYPVYVQVLFSYISQYMCCFNIILACFQEMCPIIEKTFTLYAWR